MKVYIPKADAELPVRIARGSGIVGTPVANNPAMLCIDYEGDLYDASNIQTYADRVFHAAGRHAAQYPTGSRAWVPAHTLTEVGDWNGQTIVVNFDTTPALAAWLGTPTISANDLYRSDYHVPGMTEAENREAFGK